MQQFTMTLKKYRYLIWINDMKKCKGCGAVLQNTDAHQIGYTPKLSGDYCQRCFRLMHYDDLTVSMRKGIDPDEVMAQIAKTDALILWVVDLFDFEASMIPGLNRFLLGKDIILLANKRDLLPATMSEEKIARFVFSRLKEMGIQIQNLIITSAFDKDSIDEIHHAIDQYANNRPTLIMGKANAGKSTLLNRLTATETLTMSRYPGTTIDFNTIEADGYTYIDTPGIEISHSMLMEVKEEDLKKILPDRRLKPTVFQVNKDQSFAIGGLARIDLIGCEHASVVFYMNQALFLHRGKVSAADELWQNHYGELLVPTTIEHHFRKHTIRKEMDKMDVVIDGLGWICVHGAIQNVSVYVNEDVNVTFRKAML